MRLNLQTEDEATRKNTLIYLMCLIEKFSVDCRKSFHKQKENKIQENPTIGQRLVEAFGHDFFEFLSEVVSEVVSFELGRINKGDK